MAMTMFSATTFSAMTFSATTFSAFTWLVHGAVASTILLALAALAAQVVRQPADRLRLIQWFLAATLGALALVAIPQFSVLSLGVLAANDAQPPKATPPAVKVSMPDRDSLAQNMHPADAPGRPEKIAATPQPPRSPLRAKLPPAELPPSAPAAPIDWTALAMRAVCIAYAFGMAAFFARWAVARLALARLLGGSRAVPPDVHAELARIAGPGAARVRLFASPDVAGPVTWGTRRPVIVIPSSVVENRDAVRLRYFLAHEWGHVARRDFATWQFATLLQIFLYYQPLFWWLRGRLAICMDQLADADASDQGESTADYADFLVQLARLRMAPHPQLTLGIGGRKSGLYQRVVFLLNRATRPRPSCPRAASLFISATALALAAFISVVRLDAEPPSAEKEKPAAASRTTEPPAAKSVTYTGDVTDRVTGRPIAGVKLSVFHENSDDWSLLQTTEHETGADGTYTFVVPSSEVALDSLYIEVEAHHPNYAALNRSGYSHSMIRKNLEVGEEPFYQHIQLWPGEPISGTVVTAEGRPVADAQISIFASTNTSPKSFRGMWDKTRTDDNGAFRIVPPTPGDGVLWIKPAQFSPQAHRIGDRRGDWGKFVVAKDPDLVGRVLDVQGQPVAGVKIAARRDGDGEKIDEYLRQRGVANGIGRETVSGPEGEFTLASLPGGDYTIDVQSSSESYDPPPLEQVFVRKYVSIAGGTAPRPLEIRAVPHVVVHGTYLDSAGRPHDGFDVSLYGYLDGKFCYAHSNASDNGGKFEIRAPHGMEKAEVRLITNEHTALRWRTAHDKPLRRSDHAPLGTLEDDVYGFEVVRYTAPILLVKPVDEAGAALADCTPIVKYMRPQEGEEKLTVYTTGSNVSFEKQRDGRWRSSQLLPDEPLSVTVEKTGYTTTAQELSLAEGAERELAFVLKKDAAAAADEKADDQKPAAAPPPAEKTAATPETPKPAAKSASPYASFAPDGSITYTGEVTDAVTGKPIEGVNVSVHHKNSLDWSTMEVTEHQSGADGRYSFVVSPKEAALDSFYIEVEAHHPSYCPKSRSGYSHAMIKKNLELGEDPFYSHIRLWPGEAVTGTIVTPQGRPLADVKVSMYSVSAQVKEPFEGAWGETKTDAGGNFRIVPATPGDGVLWIKPAEYSPPAHRLADRRGDWGKLTVEKGADLSGRILDVQGQPVAGVKIEARRRGDGDKPDEFLQANSVANQIGRETVSGPAGQFTLASLPAGEYSLEIQSNSDSYDPPPLEQVFLRKQVTIVDGSAPEPLEIRAVPHVVIQGTYLSSAFKPRRGHEVSLFGRMDGEFYYVRSNTPGEDGKFEIKAPHGLQKAELDMSTNEHSSLRWRMAHDEPLKRGRRVPLGTLEDDVRGFEIVRYKAPIVLVKPVDEAGAPIKQCAPVLKYTRDQEGSEQLTVYTTGSHVSFEEQQDGRWRSEQLLPDEPISVTVEKSGYSTTTQELSLGEGEQKELTFVLKKEPDQPADEKKPQDKNAEEK
jgi:beta-lactamase regulating signal transducer with metallopeptidase domain/5-hydroxyisourate hydrolase-like protein (transthyretin family)